MTVLLLVLIGLLLGAFVAAVLDYRRICRRADERFAKGKRSAR